MSRDNSIVILANGQFPSARQGLDLLRNAKQLVCCDGAADKLIGYGLTPDIIVGDMDSVSEETAKRFASSLIRSGDQETNDLTKAVEYCISQGYPAVSILGATGLREDHTLGNISLMTAYFPRIAVRIISDYGIFFLVRSGEEVRARRGDKISIFAIDSNTHVTSKGLKFPMKDLQLSNWYIATLNEAVEERFTLLFDGSVPLIVYRAW
jgi:thiamine pyrophosphokinase